MKVNMSFSKITSVINIVFLIILENFAMDLGMGYFGISLLFMYLLYELLAGGVSSSIVKMVSARVGRDDTNGAARVFKAGLIYNLIVGGLVILFGFLFGNPIFHALSGSSYFGPVLIVLSFVFLVDGFLNVMTAYYSGTKNDALNFLIRILKTVLPIPVSFLILKVVSGYGRDVAALLKNPAVENAYFAIGISFTYLLAFLIVFLVAVFIMLKNHELFSVSGHQYGMDSKFHMILNFMAVSVRYSIRNIITLLALTFSILLYMALSLRHSGSSAAAVTTAGILFTRVLLPFYLLATLFSEYCGRERNRLHMDFLKGENRIACTRCQHMIKNTFFLFLPVAVACTFLSEPIVKVFYTGKYSASSVLLKKSGFLILCVGLCMTVIYILKGLTKERTALSLQFAGLAAQMISMFFLYRHFDGKAECIIFSFYIYYLVQIIPGFAIIFHEVRMNLLELLIKIGKYLLAALITTVLYVVLDRFIMMNVFLMILTFVMGYLVYYLTVIAVRGISKTDVQALKNTLAYLPVSFLTSRLHLW